MRNKKFLLGVLLLLGIGFAAVSTTLLMSGNVNISTNNDDFDVIFTKAILDNNNISSTAIIDGGKKITFGTKDLVTVGDISKLDFEVTNNSEMYDAEVSINCTSTGTNSNYYQIISSGAMIISGKRKGTGNVQIKLLKASVENLTESFTCTLTATAKERISRSVTYYAFGDPLTEADRTTDYTTLTYPYNEYNPGAAGQPAKVFLKLDGVQKSVCSLYTGIPECFKNNNWEEEKGHIQEVFGDACIYSDTEVRCTTDEYYCAAFSDGYVKCTDNIYTIGCGVESDGSSFCNQ